MRNLRAGPTNKTFYMHACIHTYISPDLRPTLYNHLPHFPHGNHYVVLCCTVADFRLEVVVTAEGNLMITVTLQVAIPGPVRLRILYTGIVQPIQVGQVEQTTRTTFENMREIVHEVSRSDVPFQQFRLQVALEVFALEVVGPFVPVLVNTTVISKHLRSQLYTMCIIIPTMSDISVVCTILNIQAYQCHPQASLLHFQFWCPFLSS